MFSNSTSPTNLLTHLVIRLLKELSLHGDFPVLPDQLECVAYVPCFEGGPVDCQYVFSESIELGPPPTNGKSLKSCVLFYPFHNRRRDVPLYQAL